MGGSEIRSLLGYSPIFKGVSWQSTGVYRRRLPWPFSLSPPSGAKLFSWSFFVQRFGSVDNGKVTHSLEMIIKEP
jgi:hypothetical protein